MRTIWKFSLTIGDTVDILMPQGAELLHAECQFGDPYIWAIVNLEAKKVTRRFYVRGTGHVLGIAEKAKHVATFLHFNGEFVWHVFDAGEISANLGDEPLEG